MFRQMKTLTAIISAGALAAVAASAQAGLVVTATPAQATWQGSPVLTTSQTPMASATVNQGLPTGGALTQTFMTGSTGFQLDKFAVYVTGTPATGTLHLFENPYGGNDSDGYVTIPDGATDLFGNGAGLSFTGPAMSGGSFLVFDLTGADQVTLKPDTQYALDFRGVSGGTTYIIRSPDDAYLGGNLYSVADASSDNGRYDVSGSGGRDGMFALYAVPEPGSMALLALGGLGLLLSRRKAGVGKAA